jgi:hypothetical protein
LPGGVEKRREIKMILTILLVIIGVSLMVLAIYLVPKWQTKRIKEIEPKQKWGAENEFRKTLIQVFGGLVVITGLFFAYQELRNFQISQENMKAGQIATRFSKAIELLPKEKDTTSRIGGIYALEQIAREAPENYLWTVIEVISAFVRNAEVDPEKPEGKKGTKGDKEKPKEKKGANEKKEENYKIKPETQIAMTVLGRIRTEKNKKHWEKLPRINLRHARMRYANLRGANFMRADLAFAKLTEADLTEADLTGAVLTYAKLTRTYLTGAILTEADLMLANLTGAFLTNSNLTRSTLTDADLTDADFMDADFMDANLTDANLMGADLTGAKNLKVDQLLKVKTLYKVRGLPPEMEEELEDKKSELLKLPKK